MDNDNSDLGELTHRFVNWQAAVDGSPCPLTGRQLLLLAALYKSESPNSRRMLLREARKALLLNPRQLAADVALVKNLNELREELAESFLGDSELSPETRVREAVTALSTDASQFDDLERPRTLHLIGDIFSASAEGIVDDGDLAAAAGYYAKAWQATRTPEWLPSARRAVIRLQQITNDRACNRSKPNSADEHRQMASTLLAEMIQVSESAIERAWLSLKDAVHSTIQLEPADQVASGADRAWEAIVRTADGIITAPELNADQLSLTTAPLLDQAWDSALGLTYANFVAGRLECAHMWARRMAESRAPIVLLHQHPTELDERWRNMVRDLIEVQAVMTPFSDKPPREALSVIGDALKPHLRDWYMDWCREGGRRPGSSGVGFSESGSIKAMTAKFTKASERSKVVESFDLTELAHRIVNAKRRGRLGIALSGGGFRASFFHLGVLARLADLDLLRSVEIISGVSGGSIIGACYFLKLKQLLEQRHDAEVSRDDYVTLIASLSDEFLAGVQRNIRMRVFVSLPGILRLWFKSGYTRTDRVAELLASELFSRVVDDVTAPHAALSDLRILPLGERLDFDPNRDNWHRAAKVPIFVINATSLNTGHNWQFTTWTAGEPALAIDPEVDATPRLQMFEYPRSGSETAREGGRRITLAGAVAASACVPGIFPPIEFEGLYDDALVKLVDGGVFDNQGISTLLGHRCAVVVVSDGCGQIQSDPTPASSWWSALQRTNTILMERVRQLQCGALLARQKLGSPRRVFLLHLTKGLEVGLHRWKGVSDLDELVRWEAKTKKIVQSAEALLRGKRHIDVTQYDISVDVQRSLAQVRTDLDSFHDFEASALFCDGYRIAAIDLAGAPDNVFIEEYHEAASGKWSLARAWPLLGQDGRGSYIVQQLLDVSRRTFGKVACFYPKWTIAGLVAAFAALVLLGWLATAALSTQPWLIAALSYSALLVVVFAATVAVWRGLRHRMSHPVRTGVETFIQLLGGCVLPFALLGSLVYLKWIDPLYLKKGSLRTERKAEAGTAEP